MVLFGSVAVLQLFLSAVGIYYFEGEAQPEEFGSVQTVFGGLWHPSRPLDTATSIPLRQAVGSSPSFVLIVGLRIVAVPSGLVASALSEARRLEAEEQEND